MKTCTSCKCKLDMYTIYQTFIKKIVENKILEGYFILEGNFVGYFIYEGNFVLCKYLFMIRSKEIS